LDKVEAIPGFTTSFSKEEFMRLFRETGLVLAGQSSDLAPADGVLYKLRDVTGTVQSIPLIASSVMSKKIAGGARAIVLDVKVGVGAFMRNLDEARQLSRLMVSIGKLSGRRVTALLSDMNQPLGNAVGNALEVKEAIATLQGHGPEDFWEHCLTVAAHMLLVGEKAHQLEEAREIAEKTWKAGAAWQKFRSMVINQGGDVAYVDHPEKMALAPIIEMIPSPNTVDMGAGRKRKEDEIDHSVGVIIHHKVGDRIEKNDALFTIHARDQASAQEAKQRILAAHEFSDSACTALPLFYETIT
jgi:pyrimidine-nucleoside phosphorylase